MACQCAGPDTGEHKGASFHFISTPVHIHLSGDIHIRFSRSEGESKKVKKPTWSICSFVVAFLNIRQTVKIMSMLSRFDGKPLKSPDRHHSSHSAEANAIQPVNQAIKFNLAHLSPPGFPTEALCLRMQNETRDPAGLQGTVMYFGG